MSFNTGDQGVRSSPGVGVLGEPLVPYSKSTVAARTKINVRYGGA